ncbi:hypothetical protein ABZT28_55280 [Streptomyces sp. NPDC005388]|uniref:hypothetical protein n=1 Tax=Streptomyces sp. NPDC005388 TaxID=3156717 RepID=UPI0033B32BAE
MLPRRRPVPSERPGPGRGELFPDQFAFLDFLHGHHQDNAHLFLTGTTVELTPDNGCVVEQIPYDEIAATLNRRITADSGQERRCRFRADRPLIEELVGKP